MALDAFFAPDGGSVLTIVSPSERTAKRLLETSARHGGARFSPDGKWVAYSSEESLKAFNDWAFQRGGIPLLNQSPFVKKEHVVQAYGDRWKQLGDWLRTIDPDRRMVNEFFAELL